MGGRPRISPPPIPTFPLAGGKEAFGISRQIVPMSCGPI